MDNSEPHVDDLLDQLRHISITSLVDGHSDEQTSQHEWSPSKQTPPFQASESPLSSRSPPAAAYLASSVSAHDILNFSLSPPLLSSSMNRSVGEPPGAGTPNLPSFTHEVSAGFYNGIASTKSEKIESGTELRGSPAAGQDGHPNGTSTSVSTPNTDPPRESANEPQTTSNEKLKDGNSNGTIANLEDEISVDSNGDKDKSEANSGSSQVTVSATREEDGASRDGDSNLDSGHSDPDAPSEGLNEKSTSSASTLSTSKLPTVQRSLTPALSFGRISLNPNAAEFVPTSNPNPVPSAEGPNPPADSEDLAPTLKLRPNHLLASIPRTDSTNSNASDDEYRRYWREHLPDELLSHDDVALELPSADDINEFNDHSAGSRSGLGQLPGVVRGNPRLSRTPVPRVQLSGSPRAHMQGSTTSSSPPAMNSGWMMGPNAGPIQHGSHPNSFPGPPVNSVPGPHHALGAVNSNGFGYGPRPQASPPRNSISPFSPPGPAAPRFPPPHMRDAMNSGFGRPFPHPDARPGMPPPFELPPGPAGLRERPPPPPWVGDGFDMIGDMQMDGPFVDEAFHDPLAFLVAEFPSFAPESLADIFFANNGDMPLTMDMLTQLEIQEENVRPSRLPPPTLTPLDFPSLSGIDMMNGIPPHHPANLDSSMGIRRLDDGERSLPSRPGMPVVEGRIVSDFASVVRKQAPWQYDRNGMEAGSGRGRGIPNSPFSVSSFPPEARSGAIGERAEMFSHPHDLHRHHQSWMEPGEATPNMLNEIREEARDHARIRNMYFEQATQAYINGNKVLAKELSLKGQWHNDQMKVAHARAGETLFRQRNPSGNYPLGANPIGPGGQPRVLDLHSLHVSEAIQVLKRELTSLKASARNSRQRLQLLVFVGNGQNVKGRPSTRLSSAVERYIVEEEHLHFIETQPGMLRVFL